MQLWLFLIIFGLVLFVPAGTLFLWLHRLRNTINVLIKKNGSIIRIVINSKTLEKGEITEIKGKKIKPIKIKKEEVYFGTWRRWIIKAECENKNNSISDREIEEYLNNEDLIKLYLAGKFKDTLMLFLYIIIGVTVIGFIINGYLITSIESLDYSNSTSHFIYSSCKKAITEVVYNASSN